MTLPAVGDILVRIADEQIVEVVGVDGHSMVVVVPYAVMKGHKRLTPEALEHPDRAVSSAALDFREVTDADLPALRAIAALSAPAP